MSEQLVLTVDARVTRGARASRRMRAKSLVPGVYYNAKGENVPFVVEYNSLRKIYNKVGLSQVFQVDIRANGQSSTQPAIIRDIQHHPVKGLITHVDFFGVDLTKKIHVYIPVEVTGKAKGLILGGLLQVFREELEVVGLPLAIPEKVVIDVSHLGINHSVHVQDLTLPSGVTCVFDDNFAVVGVVSPAVEKEPGEEEEEAALAESSESEA